MTGTAEDIEGHRFGLLTVVGREQSPDNRSRWLCRCDCGCRIITRGDLLRRGVTGSCGCQRSRAVKTANTKHGLGNTRVYRTWIAMVARCRKPTHDAYADYGGRGITVCDQWAQSFVAFFEAVGHPPDGHTLERIDNMKGYEPGNVRWATHSEQARNRRNTRLVFYRGHSLCLADAVDLCGRVAYSTVLSRLKRGWPVRKAIEFSVGHVDK